MSERWTLDAIAELAFRHWDGETVVHHLLSNDTHLLAEPAGWILGRLGTSGALAIDEIAAGGPFDAADLMSALDAMGELGLLVQC